MVVKILIRVITQKGCLISGGSVEQRLSTSRLLALHFALPL